MISIKEEQLEARPPNPNKILYIRPNTLEILEENAGKILEDFAQVMSLSEQDSKSTGSDSKKTNRMNGVGKLLNYKEIVNRGKGKLAGWRNLCQVFLQWGIDIQKEL